MIKLILFSFYNTIKIIPQLNQALSIHHHLSLFESVFDRLASRVVNQRLELLSQCYKNKNIPMLRQILLSYLTPALKTAARIAQTTTRTTKTTTGAIRNNDK